MNWNAVYLFVDPAGLTRIPVDEFLVLEPQLDLLLRRLDGVRPVTDVPADLDAKVAPDGARLAVDGVRLAQHDAARLDGVEALPDHGHDGARGHVLDQSREEGLLAEVGVVRLEVLDRGLHELHGHQLEALLLEPLDDVADDAALHAVRLDHDEGPLVVGHNSS